MSYDEPTVPKSERRQLFKRPPMNQTKCWHVAPQGHRYCQNCGQSVNQTEEEKLKEEFKKFLKRYKYLKIMDVEVWQIADWWISKLHQAKQQGRQEGVRSVVEIFDNYFPYAMGCHSCREITLRELETLKEAIKKELL